MKATRYILALLCLCMTVIGASAQKNNRLTIDDIVTEPGTTAQLPVSVSNTSAVVGLEFDLTLPENMTMELTATPTDRVDGHQTIIRNMGGSTYKVLLYSPTNQPLRGNSGAVLKLGVRIPENIATGREYPLSLANALLGDASGENVLTAATAGKIIVGTLPDLTVNNIMADKTTFKPGERVSISWKVQNLGQLATGDGWSEQVSLLSEDGTDTKLIATEYYRESLAGGTTVNRRTEVDLPKLFGMDGRVRVQVRVVPFEKVKEPAEAKENNIGLSDAVYTVSKELTLEISPMRFMENEKKQVSVKISRSGSWNEEQSFSVAATADNRLSAPASVTIPKDQSGVIVYWPVNDNTTLDDDSVVNVTINGNGYDMVSQRIIIVDNELPTLTLKASPAAITEGESISFTVTAQRAPAEDLPLKLACDIAKRFEIPADIILPKGKKQTTFTVESTDDDQPSTTQSPTFTISADGYEPGEAITILYDNDVPAISLSLSPTTMSESAGPAAMIAVLRRTTHTDKEITVKLSDDSKQHDINYGQFTSILMPKGVEEVKFSIGVNDNLEVDGDRDVKVTAAVYIQSCSCSASGEDAGVVSQTIHIVDNDGPSLTMTSSRSMLMEGADEATVLTITRNTSTANPLTVSITSNYDEGLEYPHSVVIPVGEKTVKVTVKALPNMEQGDNEMVTFTAKAAGHSDGTCWAMMSDQTLPDAIVSKVELLTEEGEPLSEDGVMVNSIIQARFTIENIGVVDLPTRISLKVYQSAGPSVAAPLITSEPLAPGETTTLSCLLNTPEQVCTLGVYAKVNEDESVKELLYANNTSPTAMVSIISSFKPVVSVDKNSVLCGETVTIQGNLSKPDGSAWQEEGKTRVLLYFLINGQRYLQDVYADEKGDFSFEWTPSRAYMGHVGIGACHLGESTAEEMASVEVIGMRLASNRNETFYTVLNETYNGTFAVNNPSRLPLTGLTINVAENTDGADIIFDAPTIIEGGQTAVINYTLTGRKLGDVDWQKVSLDLTTNEGAELSHNLYYYTRLHEAKLSCSVKEINSTMIKGGARDYSFSISNIGMGNSGTVSLVLPDWIQSITPQQMPSMALGDTAEVVLRFIPTDDMPLNVPVTGHIGINCENGQGLALPFRLEPVSESTGKLVVDVCDEFTYYTEEAPHVSGATVSILHPATGAVIAQGITDDKGLFEVTLPEGYYSLLVTHPTHHGYNATILLDPGRTTTKIVNLMFDAIDVSWEVVETTVEDTYEIVTTVKYDTNVPVPVVTVSMPKSIPAKKLAYGESLVYHATLTNVGLITAKGVTFSMPKGFTALKFEALDHEEPFELAAQQSVVIPIKVTNISPDVEEAPMHRVKPIDNDPCLANNELAYFYVCGTDSMFHKYPTGINVGDCNKNEATEQSGGAGGGGYSFGYGWDEQSQGGPGGRPNYPKPLFGTDVNVKTVEATGEPYKCAPCGNLFFLNLSKILPITKPIIKAAEEAKNIINCATAINTEETVHDKMAKCKYTERAVKVYDKFANAARDMYDQVGETADLAEDLYGHMKNKEFLTDECLEDYKGIAKSLFNMGKDAVNIASSTKEIADGITNISDKFTGAIDELKEMENGYLQETSYNFAPTADQNRDKYLDDLASGKIQQQKDAFEAELKENMYNYFKQDFLTYDDLKTQLGKSSQKVIENAAAGEDLLTKKDKREIAQVGVKGLFQLAWNSHDFQAKAKEMSYGQQNILKESYYETEDKILDHLDDILDFVDNTLGDCDYEGDEKPEEDPGSGGSGGSGGGSSWAPRRAKSNVNTIPESYRTFTNSMRNVVNILQAEHTISLEYFGASEWLSLTPIEYAPVSWAIDLVMEEGPSVIDDPNIFIYCPDGISEEMLRTFLRRWYNTFGNGNGTQGDGEKINMQLIEEMQQVIYDNTSAIMKGHTGDIEDVITEQAYTAYDELKERSNTVCASITLQFKQTMTMTRQAFRGTLKVHNGNEEEAMKDVTLEIEVRNANDGTLATSHEMYIGAESLNGFEGALSLTDGWTLAPNSDGTATVLFIPTKYAAPTEPVDYTFGGRLRYLDPFTNLVVTRELSPVTLTVKPSPELDLVYFMQRDIYGDDPLTTDVVEPCQDAEFALVVHNKGYGEATNVKMVTQQPQIVDNAKGLYIDFELMSSQLNGGESNLALGESVVTDFGNIASGTSMYAQWWLRCSLLGHFTDYDVQATHVTSYGNEDLSLLDEVSIHELIHGFTVSEGLRGFLVNDIPDKGDYPDQVYFSDANHQDVAMAREISLTALGGNEYLLSVAASLPGWVYGVVDDPRGGHSIVESVVRQSDGKPLPTDNVWLTDRTLRDTNDPIYENKLHFTGELLNGSEQYVITFTEGPEVELEVDHFEGVPEVNELAYSPIEEIRVVFNKPVVAETFTTDDLSLTCQGAHLDVKAATVRQIDEVTFAIGLNGLTLTNGFYVLTVNTVGITDSEGYQGYNGKSASWTQFTDEELVPMSLSGQVTARRSGLPVKGAVVTLRHDDLLYTATTDVNGRYVVTVSDNTLPYDVTCSAIGYLDSKEGGLYIPDQGVLRSFSMERGVVITMPADGICTYSSDLALDFSRVRGGEMRAYYGKRYNQASVTIEQVTTVEAGEGLVLIGDPKARMEVPEAENPQHIEENLFLGTAYEPYIVTSDDIYVLANLTGKPKFHRARKGLSIPMHKAYIILLDDMFISDANGVEIIYEGTNGIDDLRLGEDDGHHFSVGGTRIHKKARGIHIQNGKKFIVK